MASAEATPLIAGGAGGSSLQVPPRKPLATHHEADTERNKLGTFNGVFIPCSLNILGIVLFMRLPWIVGQAGMYNSIGVLVLAETCAVLTVLSLSAITTNGKIEGGGSYYLISRVLGPEFGGAIGILFYLAYAVGVAFYIIGFATAIQTTFLLPCSDVDPQPGCVHADPKWVIRGCASAGLIVILIISLLGAGFFAKFNTLFFVIQTGAIVVGLVSFLVPHDFISINTDNGNSTRERISFPHRFEHNLSPSYTESAVCQDQMCGFHSVFAIAFPMATGIMEGANLSGDLNNPSKSLPLGTLGAVGFAIMTYLVLIVSLAGSVSTEVLQSDLNVFQNSCLGTQYIVVTGILISSLSSALGSLFGAARILQAIARDDLFPCFGPFKYGSRLGDEPRVAVMATWVITQCCIFIGDLDIVAPIITSFFLLSYALVNLTCFSLSVIGSPNFRPTFRYYSWLTAAVGVLINLATMFFLNWQYSLGSFLLLIGILVYLSIYGPAKDWGDVSQALLFHQVRKYLLRLQQGDHPKFWKPNLLVLNNSGNTHLLDFCNDLKKGGLLVVGHVLDGDIENHAGAIQQLRKSWDNYFQGAKLKAFAQVTAASPVNVAYRVLMSCAGIGGLQINSVVMPLSAAGAEDSDDLSDVEEPASPIQLPPLGAGSRRTLFPLARPLAFVHVLEDALSLQKNVLVTRNFGAAVSVRKRTKKMPRVKVAHDGSRPNIDVWIVGDWKHSAPGFGRMTSLGQPGSGAASVPRSASSTRPTTPLNIQGLDQQSCDMFTPSLEGAGGATENEFVGASSLTMQLGQILYHKRFIRKLKPVLRILSVPDVGADLETIRAELVEVCFKARMDVEPEHILVLSPGDISDVSPTYQGLGTDVSVSGLPDEERCCVFNEAARAYSAGTGFVLAPLPLPPSVEEDEAMAAQYVSVLNSMVGDLPPTALIAAGQLIPFISVGI